MLYLRFIEPGKIIVPVSVEAFIIRESFYVVVKTGTGSHIIGPDITVSRDHARIYYYNGKYYIQDLGSLNGTRINAKYIKGWEPRRLSEPVELVEGDVVEVGLRTMFRVEFEKEAEEILARKDSCSVIILLRTYLFEAITKIYEILLGRGERERLADLQSSLQSSLKQILSKETFSEVIGKIDENACVTIKRYINFMNNPQMFLESPELLDGLRRTLESVIDGTRREFELCSLSQQTDKKINLMTS